MKLTFNSMTAWKSLTFDTEAKTYAFKDEYGTNGISVKSNKELKELEILLIKEGYNKTI